MADLSDVENYLVQMAASAIYPNGIENPSVANFGAMIYSGYPSPSQLDNDFSPDSATPRAHINVNFFMDKDVSDMLTGWQTVTANPPTLFLTVDNSLGTITVSGTISIPQNCAIKVNKLVYHYSVNQSDTLETIANNIAALIPSANASQTTISIPGAYQISTNVGKTGQAINAVGQQRAIFKITVLAPSYTYRDTFAKAIQGYFDANYRFVLPDSSGANISYKSSKKIDEFQKTIIYRRDLMYQVTYYTTIESTFYTITDTPVNITNASQI